MMRTEETLVTKEIAQTLLSLNGGNRLISERVVKTYSEEMKSGNWLSNGETIKVSNKNRLIDGQHRLAAILKTGIPQLMLICYGIDDKAFKTIDCGKLRNASDCLFISGEKYTTNLAASLRYVYSNKINPKNPFYASSKKITNNEILSTLNDNQDIKEWVAFFGSKKGARDILIYPSMMSAIAYLLSINSDKELVCLFFNKLKFGLDLKQDSPVYRLRETLIKNKSSSFKLQAKNIWALTVKSFYYFKQGKAIKALRWSDNEDFPEIV